MKILEVIPNLQAGGAETFIVNLSNALASKEVNEVTILTLYHPNESEFLRGRIDKRVKVVSLNKHMGIDIRMLFSVLRFVKQGNFDIAHFHIQAIIYSLLSCFSCVRQSILQQSIMTHSKKRPECIGWREKFCLNLNCVKQ